MRKRALFFEALGNNAARCDICNRRCVIKNGERGWCTTRENEGGVIYSLIYSCVSSMMISPAEKKPFFHFYPGSMWLSLGSVGCNFRCPGCQNWHISRQTPTFKDIQHLAPESIVRIALENNCTGISWTYNEPTLWFEYTLDSAKIAKDSGLYTNYVTNGYITKEAFGALAPYLDVFRVDIKGFSNATYRKVANISNFEKILEVVEFARATGTMHIEIVTNIIPSCNDDQSELRAIARWIKNSLGRETPWHLTAFYPHLYLSHLPPTPVSTLERAREIGLEEGLWYVYIGNVPGHPAENTYCHSCHNLLVSRTSIFVREIHIKNGLCPYCQTPIPGRF